MGGTKPKTSLCDGGQLAQEMLVIMATKYVNVKGSVFNPIGYIWVRSYIYILLYIILPFMPSSAALSMKSGRHWQIVTVKFLEKSL